MRYSLPINNVTAPKYFESISIEQFYCDHGCTVQDVDISEWIAKSVLTYGNYTIQGTTTIDNPIFYNDIRYKNFNNKIIVNIILIQIFIFLRAFGLVNNMTFNKDSILLTNHAQNFNGNIHIDNRNLENNQITTLSIENVYLKTINDIEFDKFLDNIAYRDNAVIWTNLLFHQRLTVNNLHVTGKWNGVDAEGMIYKLQVNRLASNYTDHLEQLNMVGRSLADNLRSNFFCKRTFSKCEIIFRFFLIPQIKYDTWNRTKLYKH